MTGPRQIVFLTYGKSAGRGDRLSRLMVLLCPFLRENRPGLEANSLKHVFPCRGYAGIFKLRSEHKINLS